MIGDETTFWLIHIFIGLLLPFLVLSGCCRNDMEEKSDVASEDKIV